MIKILAFLQFIALVFLVFLNGFSVQKSSQESSKVSQDNIRLNKTIVNLDKKAVELENENNLLIDKNKELEQKVQELSKKAESQENLAQVCLIKDKLDQNNLELINNKIDTISKCKQPVKSQEIERKYNYLLGKIYKLIKENKLDKNFI